MKRTNYIMIFLMMAIVALIGSCELLEEDDDPNLDKLEGEWSVDESSSQYKSTLLFYTVYIQPETENSNKYEISNFYDLGFYSYVIGEFGNMKLTIDNYKTSDGFTINGTGDISSNYNKIEWTYTVDDGSGEVDNVTATYSKKD